MRSNVIEAIIGYDMFSVCHTRTEAYSHSYKKHESSELEIAYIYLFNQLRLMLL